MKLDTIYRTFRTVWIAVIVATLAACTDEEIFGTYGEEGRPIELKLNFKATAPEVKVTSRALNEYAVNDLYVFIFNAQTGDLRTSQFYSYDDLTKGDIGSQPDTKEPNNWIKIKTTTGASRIYAIANVDESVNIYGDVVGAPDDQKKDLKTQLGYITTEDELKALSLNIKESVNRVGECYVMSGVANDGNNCTIGITNTNPNPILIKLRRLDAEITFNFYVGDKNYIDAKGETKPYSFEVTSFQVFNVPKKTYVLDHEATQKVTPAGDDGEEVTVEWDAANTKGDFFNTREYTDVFPENKDGKKCTTFTFYMAENRKNAKGNIENYSGREEEIMQEKPKDSTNPNANSRKYKNAPNYGTYVLVKGKFVGYSDTYKKDEDESNDQYSGEAEANVRYIIHLGYVDEKATDFFCNRNTKYTYNVTVKGVEHIVVEVVKEEENAPGAEGDVLFNNGKGIYKLDAHYETVLLSFKKTELENAASNSLNKDFFSYQIKTPYGNYTNTLLDDNTWETEYQDENKIEADEGWIRIRRNEINDEGVYSSDLGLYNEEGKEGEYLTIRDLMLELKNIAKGKNFDGTDLGVGKSVFDSKGNVVYTCHINEFYYGKKSWNTFVNTDNRELHILNQVKESSDQLSSIVSSAYIISQRSIQTFYRTDDVMGDFNAYGAETINETGALESYQHYNGQIGIYSNDLQNLDSGRDNFKTILSKVMTLDVSKWGDYVDWSTNGYKESNTQDLPTIVAMKDNTENNSNYQRAYLACMQRNRDLDGDGTISDKEIRWYLPAQNQYVGMFLGVAGLSDESKLYPNSETQYKHIHYVSSTVYDANGNGSYDQEGDNNKKGDGLVVYWAEEAVSTSYGGLDVEWTQNYDGDKHQYRCMRNLYNVAETDGGNIQTFYKVEGTNNNGQGVKVTVPYLNTASLRSELLSRGELGTHTDNQNESRIGTGGFITGPRVGGDHYVHMVDNSTRPYNINTVTTRNPEYRVQFGEWGQLEISGNGSALWEMNGDGKITCGFTGGNVDGEELDAEAMRNKYVAWLENQNAKDENGDSKYDKYTQEQIERVKNLPLTGDFNWNTGVFTHFYDFDKGTIKQYIFDQCDTDGNDILDKNDIVVGQISCLAINRNGGNGLWDMNCDGKISAGIYPGKAWNNGNDGELDSETKAALEAFGEGDFDATWAVKDYFDANAKNEYGIKDEIFDECDINKDGILDEKDISVSYRLEIKIDGGQPLWDMNFDGEITGGLYHINGLTDKYNNAPQDLQTFESENGYGGDIDNDATYNHYFAKEGTKGIKGINEEIFRECDLNSDGKLDINDQKIKEGFNLGNIISSQDYITPCRYLKTDENGNSVNEGYWRVPNVRELYMMLIADDYLQKQSTTGSAPAPIIYKYEAARTEFRFKGKDCTLTYENYDDTKGHHRDGWYRYDTTKKLNMQPIGYVNARCVRDNGAVVSAVSE